MIPKGNRREQQRHQVAYNFNLDDPSWKGPPPGPVAPGSGFQGPPVTGPPGFQGAPTSGPNSYSGPQISCPPGGPPGPIPGPIPTPNVMPNVMPSQTIPTPMDRPLDHGRHTPYFGQPDYRIYELNKRLQQRTEESDNLWWDAFATEFFEDDATLTLTFCLEDGPKRYSVSAIGRTLIPRYFRSIFEGGVTDLYYNLKHPKESFHNTTITLDCDQCTMVTHHGKPMFTKVCTEGRLILEFTFDDLMRIKSWHFATRQHRELIPRSVIAMQQDPAMLEQLSKNITRQGLTNFTLNYLRLCVILEPMQELMSRHKAYALSPRDCLKTTLFQKWQRMVAPPGPSPSQPNGNPNQSADVETQRPPSKRRKRKSSTSGTNAGGGNSSSVANNGPGPKKKMSPGPQNFSLASQDVMVVGEPSLMGGEFGDEDERLITRLENTQYDATNGLDEHEDFSNSPMTSTASPWAGAQDRSAGPNPQSSIASQEGDKKSPAISQ